ncbi:MAG: type IV secretion system DNA-binding domain-containing protein [Gemmataceae bacterium]|nr:type IV secretion system DNA-binding domain-containing protein [Gemmataceae bacterium]
MQTIFLGQWLALEAPRHNVLMVGGPGTGKSLLLKILLLSISELMREQTGLNLHVLDFDTKGDLYDLDRAYPDNCLKFDLDPFVEGHVYDIMAEVDDPRDIREMAALFIDIAANETQKFFPQSARSIATKLWTRHWLEASRETTFADIVRTCTSLKAMREVAASHPTTEALLALLGDNEVGLSIASTLIMEMDRFEIPAALYQSRLAHPAEPGEVRAVSSKVVDEFPRTVTRLPFNLQSVETLSPLTRLFLSRAQQRVLQRVDRERLVVAILDELALLPGGVDLSTGAIFGRECGWCEVLAFQTFLSAFKAFNKENLEATISTAKTFICFHLSDPQDAELAAKRFFSFEGLVREYSGTSKSAAEAFTDGFAGRGGGPTVNWSERVQEVQNVTPGMIQALNVPAAGNPVLDFYMVTVGARPARFTIPIHKLVAAFRLPPPSGVRPRPRPAGDMILFPWTDADEERLKLPPPEAGD